MKLPFFKTATEDLKKKKTRKPIKRLTSEQTKEKAEAKRLQYISDEYIGLAKKDPEIRRQMIAQAFELKLPEPPNPTKIKEKEIETKVIDRALEQINQDPALLERFTEKQIERILGEAASPRDDNNEFFLGSPMEQALEQIESYDKLKEKLGGEKKGGGGVIDLLAGLVKYIPEIRDIMALRAGQEQPTRYVVIKEDGTPVQEVGAEGYKKMLEQKQAKRLDKPKPVETPSGVTAEVPTSEATPSTEVDWTALLDKHPQDFVLEMIRLQDEGDERASSILDFFLEYDVMGIMSMLEQMKDTEDYRLLAEKMKGKEEWLQEAIDYYRIMVTGGQDA